VAVVGGGPAGLSAARAAAAGGRRVVVFERGSAIGEPVRTSGGSFIGPLRRLGVPAECWWPVRRIRMVGPGSQLVMSYRRPVACVLDVRRTYQWLAQRALDAGAGIRLRAHVMGPLVEAGRVRGVRVRDPFHAAEDLPARTVIDASGQTGLVARAAGLRGVAARSAVGMEVELHAPRYDQDEAMLIVGDEAAPSGYGWAFPCGAGRVRVGVGVLRPDTAAEPRVLLDRLLGRIPALAASDSGPLELHSGLMPVIAPGAAGLVTDGVLAVGDAAGQGSALVGEGIRYAILAGQLAGRAVAAGREAEYPAAWQRAVGRDLELAYALHTRISAYRDDDWDRALALLGRLGPRQFSQGLAGRFTLGWALGVLVTRPRLVLTGGRPLARAALARRA